MNIRVTQNAMSRLYKNNYNRSLSQMNDISNKVLSQRKFTRASENPVGAAKALSIRRAMSDNETYKDNLETAKGIFDTAESLLTNNISPQLVTVTTKLNAGANGDKGPDEHNIIATEIESVANEILKTMNSEYAGRKLYGGTNNSSVPFTYDKATNVVSYNGVPVNSKLETTVTGLGTYTSIPAADLATLSIETDVYIDDGLGGYVLADATQRADVIAGTTPGYTEDTNTTYTFNGAAVDPTLVDITQANAKFFPGSNPILIDVGLGIKYNADGTVDESTAMDISMSGADIVGNGTDKDGDSQNIIQLCFDSAKALRDGDTIRALELMDKINASKTTLLVNINNLGVKQKSVDFYTDKIDTDDYNLAASQISAEGMSLEEQAAAMTEYKSVNAAYNAVLQMGSEVVPTSIFDFMK